MNKPLVILLSLIVAFSYLAPSVLAASPSLKITHPLDGQVINGYVVEVKFEVKSFTLKDYRGEPKAVPGQGHLNFWLDPEGSDQPRRWSRDIPYTFADVSPGDHTLVVELVGNDDQVLNPRVIQTVKFKTEAAAADAVSGKDKSRDTQESPGPVSVLGDSDQGSGLISRVKVPVIIGFASLFLGMMGYLILRR